MNAFQQQVIAEFRADRGRRVRDGRRQDPGLVPQPAGGPGRPVETGTETYRAVATAPAGAERDALFAKVVAEDPGVGEYRRKTGRPIPVVALTRQDSPSS